MNNHEYLSKQLTDFNQFLKSVNLYKKDEPLVEMDKVQSNDTCLTGKILTSTKEVVFLLEKRLQQKAKKRRCPTCKLTSFYVGNKGWIIIEEYEDVSFLTLQNKWW